jgi:subtilase family serine protease
VATNAQAWQNSVAGYTTLGCASGRRSSTDIAAIADPFTGYDIYLKYNQATAGFQTYGGTSLASPVVAALWALAGGPAGVKYPALSLYGHFKSDTTKHLYDVTFGGTGSCNTSTLASCAKWWTSSTTGNPNLGGWGQVDCAWNTTSTDPATPLANRYQCYAKAGYDGVSGVGTPIGTAAFTPMFPKVVIKPPATVTHAVNATFATTGSTDPFPGGTLAANTTNVQYVWNWGDGHVDTITTSTSATHKYAAAGSHTLTLYITDNYGQTGKAQMTVTIH